MNYLAAVDIGQQFGSAFGGTSSGGGKGFSDLVSVILSNALVIAGIVALFLIVFQSISIIIAAGQNNPEKAAKREQAAIWSLVGFGIIFATFWIIRIVEAITGLKIL